MMAVFGALVGLGVGSGVWLIAAGLHPARVVPRTARSQRVPAGVWKRVGACVGVFVVVWVVSGWPAAGVVAAAVVGVVPFLRDARRARQVLDERTEALASWAEMLRDTISAHAGLREAIALTASVAPAPIRTEVRALAVQSEREPIAVALRRFARDVEDPVADLIVAALVLAADRQAQRLAELLSRIATTAREQTTMRQRIETGRARTYASSRALVTITLGLAVGLLVFSPKFMAPYRTFTGQLVLTGIGAVFAAALAGLVVMSRPAPTPRLLAGVQAVPEETPR